LWRFHQNDKRFKDDTKGNQCKCNALVYLAMNFGINNQALADLDSYLNIGDHVYRTTLDNEKEMENTGSTF
jgi:ribosomal protein S6